MSILGSPYLWQLVCRVTGIDLVFIFSVIQGPIPQTLLPEVQHTGRQSSSRRSPYNLLFLHSLSATRKVNHLREVTDVKMQRKQC